MSFFPGIISALVKVLHPKPSEKRTATTLVSALKTATFVITRVLGDELTRDLPEKHSSSTPEPDKSWLRATSSQVKLALSNIAKLRQSERDIVLEALGRLCTTCLDQCWESLVDSRSLLLETLVVVANDKRYYPDVLENDGWDQ